MISIVICSRSPSELAAVTQNISSTIGLTHEIISINNAQGQYGICEAYNIGAARSKYEVLCFMHEDIRFHTTNWGKSVVETLSDVSIGVLGVTGGQYQVAAPAAWWGCGLRFCRENVLNVFEDGHTEMELRNPENAPITDVAVVDGMWMCSRKEVWAKHPFDAKTFTGFHFYDVDYCTEIFKHGFRVCVTFQLLLEHHSRGSVNAMWVHSALAYQQKRRGQLPFGTVEIPFYDARIIERRALQEFVGRLIRGGFPTQVIIKYMAKCMALGPLNRDTMWLAKQWILGISPVKI